MFRLPPALSLSLSQEKADIFHILEMLNAAPKISNHDFLLHLLNLILSSASSN